MSYEAMTELSNLTIVFLGLLIGVVFIFERVTRKLRKQIEKQAEQIKHVEWINCRRIEAMIEDTKQFMTDGQTQMVSNAFIVAERAAAHAVANPSKDDAARLSAARQLQLEQKLEEPPTRP